MAITKIPAAGFTGNNFRNIIINGDMSIAQRGTSATNFSSYDTVDRFSFSENLGTGVATSEQETLTSGGAYDAGFRTATKISCTTADASPDVGERAYMQQGIEAQNLQQLNYGSSSAKTITLSFWVKSNMTGNFPVTIKKDDNTIHYIVHSFNISSADTWQKFTFTITPTQGSTNLITQSAAKINNDNGRGMQIFWGLYWGSNYTGSYGGTPTWTTTSNDFADSDVTYNNFFSSTSNNLSITGVQLEVGTTASDFEFLPYDVNLNRCQRYCQVYGGDQATQSVAVGAASGTTGMVATLKPLNKFRTTPSASVSAVADFNYLQLSPFATANLVSFSLVSANSSSDYVNLDIGISGATANAYQIIRTTNTGARLTLSAEL